jgi:hypothetical protein
MTAEKDRTAMQQDFPAWLAGEQLSSQVPLTIPWL